MFLSYRKNPPVYPSSPPLLTFKTKKKHLRLVIHFHIYFMELVALLRAAVFATLLNRPGQALPPLLPNLPNVHDVLVYVRLGRSTACHRPQQQRSGHLMESRVLDGRSKLPRRTASGNALPPFHHARNSSSLPCQATRSMKLAGWLGLGRRDHSHREAIH